MCKSVRSYTFACGCSIYNRGAVLGIKYDRCKNYNIYTNSLQFCDPDSGSTCLVEGNEYLPNLDCWVHNKLRKQGKDISKVKGGVYLSPCECFNSGDFVQDEQFKRARDHIYAQADTKIMLELYAEAFRDSDPKLAWGLVERELDATVAKKREYVRRGAEKPVASAPRILRPAVMEYLD